MYVKINILRIIELQSEDKICLDCEDLISTLDGKFRHISSHSIIIDT